MSGKQFFKMVAGKNNVGRVDIYDEIGFFGTSAATFARQWRDIETGAKRIDVHISSPGGNLFDALAIYNIIQQSAVPVDIYIDGLAASSASVIAMAGRKSRMAENALLMLHNPYTITIGNKDEHEASIKALEAATEAVIVAYARKSGKSADDLRAIMDAQTWYGAVEAESEGFVDVVVAAQPMAAKFDADTYGFTVPDAYRARFEAKVPEQPAKQEEVIEMAEPNKPEAPTPATITEIKAACDGCDNDFVVAQIESSATVAQAQSAWTKLLAARVKASDEKIAALETEKAAITAKQETTGVKPVGSKDVTAKVEGDVIAQWDDIVAQNIAKGMAKGKAISAAAKAHPELHRAFIAAYNDLHGGNRKSA